jgi:hypothetical protein
VDSGGLGLPNAVEGFTYFLPSDFAPDPIATPQSGVSYEFTSDKYTDEYKNRRMD